MATKKDNSPNWKVFRRDTEAGRLLSRLYGVQPTDEPLIHYPTTTTKIRKERINNGNWNVDSSAANLQKKSPIVHAPRVGNQSRVPKEAPLEQIPRRKPKGACDETVRKSATLLQRYRPPNQTASSTDAEKDRLNEVFAYKGGCALPNELTMPIGIVPSESKRNMQERDRVLKARSRRNERLYGDVEHTTEKGSNKGDSSTKELLVKQISDEIKERRQYQMTMEEAGIGASSRKKIGDEIASRLSELGFHSPQTVIELTDPNSYA